MPFTMNIPPWIKHEDIHLCEYCGQVLGSCQSLTRHIKILHKCSTTFQCSNCLRKFKRPDNMNRHLKTCKEASDPYSIELREENPSTVPSPQPSTSTEQQALTIQQLHLQNQRYTESMNKYVYLRRPQRLFTWTLQPVFKTIPQYRGKKTKTPKLTTAAKTIPHLPVYPDPPEDPRLKIPLPTDKQCIITTDFTDEELQEMTHMIEDYLVSSTPIQDELKNF